MSRPTVVLLDERNRSTGGIASLNRDLLTSRLREEFIFGQSGAKRLPQLLVASGCSEDMVLIFDESFSWTGLPFLAFARLYAKLTELITGKRRAFISREHHYSEAFFAHSVKRKRSFIWMLRCSYGLMDRVVAISSSQLEWMLKNQLSSASKIVMMEQSVDLTGLCKTPPLETQAFIVFGYIGRFSAQKGVERLLTCWSALPRDLPVRLIISGYGPMEKVIRNTAALLPDVEVVGLSDPGSFFSKCHIVVIPSRYEPYGQVCLEARAAGRILVVSTADALPEQIRISGCGYVCDFDDPISFGETVKKLVRLCRNDPIAFKRMGELGRESSKKAFSKYLESFNRLLLDVLSDGNKRCN